MNAAKRVLNAWLPRPVSYGLIYAKYQLMRAVRTRQYLGGPYSCPVCESRLKRFEVMEGTAWCPICEAGERHRVDWVFMRDHTNLLDGRPRRMLHVAPEMVFIQKFNAIPNLAYLSADLETPRAMERMDLTDIAHPDNSFDVIYCSHVLEHILDDRKAMRELYRVCRPGGWGLLQVPVTVERTLEDASAVTPQQRMQLFGQEDHVRRCGLDYPDRMREAGFQVTHVTADELLTPDQFREIGVLKTDRHVFYCQKR
jgi:SAM-dependent methyltransferase